MLFLISINVNVHSRTQDQHGLTPLLLAVQKGHSMIVRNLILAGASVHDKTPSQQTALQLAAESNLAEVCGILLSEGIDYAAVDSRYLLGLSRKKMYLSHCAEYWNHGASQHQAKTHEIK